MDGEVNIVMQIAYALAHGLDVPGSHVPGVNPLDETGAR